MKRIAKAKRSRIQEFIDLSDSEKDQIAREFENPASAETFRPLNAKERKLRTRAKKNMGRPPVGNGSKVISLSVERELLGRADALAKQKGVSRAALVAAGLHAVLKKPALLKERPAA